MKQVQNGNKKKLKGQDSPPKRHSKGKKTKGKFQKDRLKKNENRCDASPIKSVTKRSEKASPSPIINLPINAVVANEAGEIFELEDYGAVVMHGHTPSLLMRNESVEMPHGSELMMLPGMKPMVFSFDKGVFETLEENPYVPGERIFPVAVFNSPGYVNRYCSAYENPTPGRRLPLFSYGACGWLDSTFFSAAILVDDEPRQDLRLMPREGIVAGVEKMQKRYPDNRLMRHLERCALEYGCPAAKNFYLGRYEAPLPTSQVCNANCLGCISLQQEDNLVACQDRINFTPTSDEIAGVALAHFAVVPEDQAVASFGQGCEGDPLTAFHVIEPAIRQIRAHFEFNGCTINMNTNAGMPDRLAQLFDVGLDSVRVSMNSVRKSCYTTYFRPKSYTYEDVVKSIDMAGDKGKFVSINYLNCPGVTDSEDEFEALRAFLSNHPVGMIQWRNMNYDPLNYLHTMEGAGGQSPALGMGYIIDRLRQEFPKLIHGYFNPPKWKFSR